MQRDIEFFRDLRALPQPKDAPAKVLRQVETARMAMRLSVRISGIKQEAIAATLRLSPGYLSKIINERMAMPEWFPMAFAYATGSNLLRQHIAFNEALDERRDRADWIERKLANELRGIAA